MNASKTATSVCVLIVVFAASASAGPWTGSALDRATVDKNYVLDINDIVGQHLDTQGNLASLLNSYSSTAQERHEATTDVTAHAADNNIIWSISGHALPYYRAILIMLSSHGATATSIVGICDSRVIGSGGDVSNDFCNATWILPGLPAAQTTYTIGATGNGSGGVIGNNASSHEPVSSNQEPADHLLPALGSVTLAR